MSRPHKTTTSPRTIYLIKMCELLMRAGIERRLEKFGVSGLQYTILSTVSRRDRLSVADMARVCRVAPQSMGEMIAGLQEKRLLVRREDPINRRILRIELTPTGRDLFEKCDRLIDELESELFDGMTEREIRALRNALNTILDKEEKVQSSTVKQRRSSA